MFADRQPHRVQVLAQIREVVVGDQRPNFVAQRFRAAAQTRPAIRQRSGRRAGFDPRTLIDQFCAQNSQTMFFPLCFRHIAGQIRFDARNHTL